jgi:DNA-binding NarL/FixJ family response regulator
MRAKHHWKPWSAAEERRLAELAGRGATPRVIAQELDRTENAIRNKAIKLGVLLPLHNQRRRTRPSLHSL